MSTTTHPRQALFASDQADTVHLPLPVCEFVAGSPAQTREALQLQAATGPAFDVTLDLEGSAPLHTEIEHAQLQAALLDSNDNRYGRVGLRMLPVGHRYFADAAGIVLRAHKRPAYLVLPQATDLADVQRAADLLAGLGAGAVPLHVTIETHSALRDVAAIARHPRVEGLAFGLMNFVAAHRGAIPVNGISGAGQFDHPLVVRAKLEISAACHAAGKTPTHSACGEFADATAVQAAADMAASLLGYTRMCSVHLAQIGPILAAFAPSQADVDMAIGILQRAQDANWGPTQLEGQAQDRASYRAWWQLLERAERAERSQRALKLGSSVSVGSEGSVALVTSRATLPADVRAAWFAAL